MPLQRFVERLIWLSMLPLVTLLVVMVVTHLVSLEQRRDLMAKALVGAASGSIQKLLEVRLSSLQLLARTLEAHAVHASGHLNLARARELALHHVEVHGAHLVVGDRHQRMLLNTRVAAGGPLPPMPRSEGRSAVDVTLHDGVPAVGDVVWGPLIKRWTVPVVVPIRAGEEPRWTLVSPIEVREIEALLQELQLPPQWTLQLSDSSSRVLVRLGKRHLPPDSPLHLPQPIAQWPEDTHTARLSLAPWSVDLHAPPSSLLQNPHNQALMLAVTLLAASGAAYWSARIVSQRLTRSMASLVESVDDPPRHQDIDEVATVRAALRQLQGERDSAAQAERRRIGLELHDDLQQKLAVLRMDLARWRQRPTMPAAQREQETDHALRLVDQTIESTRRMVRNLRPPTLEQHGIGAALRELAVLAQQALAAQGMRKAAIPMTVDVQVMGDDSALTASPEVVLTLYRIAQEALNNIVKHAAAGHVDLHLNLEDPHEVILEVVDDGCGFDLTAATGNGLHGMQERVQDLGGRLEIQTQPGDGTALIARLPRKDPEPWNPGPCAGITAPPEA